MLFYYLHTHVCTYNAYFLQQSNQLGILPIHKTVTSTYTQMYVHAIATLITILTVTLHFPVDMSLSSYFPLASVFALRTPSM